MSPSRAGRTGRPPLTEGRKAAIRLEIAREAVRLFTANGVAATSADEIAAAADISVRTLWRYFPSKESCVLPMLTSGIAMTERALRAWAPGGDVGGLLEELQRDNAATGTDLSTLLDLVRLTRTEPELRAVWLRAHADAEPVFAAELARRAGLSDTDLTVRVEAAMVNSALRVAVEDYAFRTDPADADEAGAIAAVRAALLTAGRGLTG